MLDWFVNHVQHTTFASNVMWAVAALVAGLVMLRSVWRLRHERPDYWYTMLGVALVALPTAVQRAFWGVWTWYLAHGQEAAAAAWAAQKGFLTPLVFIIVLGYGFHIRALVQTKTRHWAAVIVGLPVTVYFTALFFVSM